MSTLVNSPRIKDLSNQVFNRLTALEFIGLDKHKRALWKCKCIEGNVIIISSNQLLRGATQSCGCLKREATIESNKRTKVIHGLDNSRFHHIWKGILARCLNPNHMAYHNYGGRGIKICERWLGENGFIHFKEDKYESYLKHVEEFGEDDTSCNRIDNNGDYTLENTEWATRNTQQKSRRISVNSNNIKEHYIFKILLTGAIWQALKGKIKSSKLIEKYVGITVPEFVSYIESQFLPGMTFTNYGKYTKKNPNTWNIDHIEPCYKFDLSKEVDRLICWNFKNLRPRWSKENRIEIL